MSTNITAPPKPSSEQRDLSIKEGAYLLSVSYNWLWRRIGTPGGPPVKKRGKVFRLPRAEFLKWADQDQIA